MDYSVLVLASILADNDPEGSSFRVNVSLSITYSLSIIGALNFTASPEQVQGFSAKYPDLISLNLGELLALT